jgi:signal transduction histidine kinase
VLQVTDNGRGIEKNNLPFIFDKFYRVQTAICMTQKVMV